MNTPSIRFKGFTDAWKQRKLSDVYQTIGNAFVGTATPYYVDSGHFYLESNNVKDGQINRNTEVFINDEFYEKQRDKWLHTGDMVMVQSGHVGHTAVIPEELDNTAAHALIMFKNPKIEVEPYFLNYQYQTGKSRKKLDNITVGNTIKHILASDMQEFIVELPKYEEQKQIAKYFMNLDDLITLHQRKCNSLKQVKKYMLQKMFPKQGEKVPEIRFAGFTGDWEQRKIGDQMYIKSRIGWQALTKKEYLNDGEYYLITGTDIDEDTHTIDLKNCYYVSKERYEMDDKIQLHEGDIIVTKDGTIGKVAMVTGLDKPATLNSHLFVLRDLSGSLDNRFLLQVLNSHVFNAFIESTKTGSTLTGLPQKTFVEFKFLAPKLEEQKRISNTLDNIDRIITLHQRKSDSLKEIKKFMLQNMFPRE